MTMSKSSSPLFILYGSATGNSEHIAKDLAAQPNVYFSSVVCYEMDQFKKKKCLEAWEQEPAPNTKHGVLVITSTTGNGDAPENASRFVRYIKRKTTVDTFKHCAFAVLGLGDTNYDQFCQCGKTVDKKMEELGGTRVRPIACADEATGLEDVVEPWTANILQDIAQACQGGGETSCVVTKNAEDDDKVEDLAADPAAVDPNDSAPPQALPTQHALGVATIRALLGIEASSPIWEANHKLLPSMSASRSSCELVTDVEEDGMLQKPRSDSIADSFSTVSSAGFHYTIKRPFESTILQARYLTQTSTRAAQDVSQVLAQSNNDDEGLVRANEIIDQHFPLVDDDSVSKAECERNGKRVIELTLALPDDYTLEYAPGDSLGLLVENTPQAVRFVLDMFREKHGILPSQRVSIDENHPITVEEAVRRQCDLCSPIKNKRILFSLSQHATDPEEACALQLLSSKTMEGDKLFRSFVDEQRLTVVDILREFPSTQSIPMVGLLGILPSIPPRYYSVSSSPIEHQRLSLTVAFSVVDYMTPSLLVGGEEHGLRRVGGIATRYMEAICAPLLVTSAVDSGNPTIPHLKIFPKPTVEFRMPNALSKPLVLIGPGTGVAPFMGFLSQRRALLSSMESAAAAQTVVEGTWRGGYEVDENELSIHGKRDASGLNVGVDFRSQQGVGSVDLFFGCRHKEHDWLYRNEMEAFEEEGIISKLYIAFSRDGEQRQYVQDIMKTTSCAERLSDLILDQNAAVYVCGDGNEMARDVQAAVVEILGNRLAGGVDEAKDYLEKMKKNKHFLMDIWS